jgi:hypothetical protein
VVRRAPRRRSSAANAIPPTSIRFPADILKWIHRRAAEKDISVSYWVISVCQAYKAYEDQQPPQETKRGKK